jgi:hypothetical protein
MILSRNEFHNLFLVFIDTTHVQFTNTIFESEDYFKTLFVGQLLNHISSLSITFIRILSCSTTLSGNIINDLPSISTTSPTN